MRDKVLNYLGLAARGRLMTAGYNTCLYMMNKKKVKLLIVAEDLSPNSVKKIVQAAKSNSVPYRIYGMRQDLSHITGKDDAGIFAITDANLAKAISEEIDHRES